MYRAELVIASILAVFGLALVLWIIPAQTQRVTEASIQPSLYPSIAGWALVAFSGALIGSRLWQLLARKDDGGEPPLRGKNWGTLALFTAILGAAVLAFRYLGFVAGGAGLAAAFMVFMGARRPVVLVTVAIGASVSIWLIFERLFERPLP